MSVSKKRLADTFKSAGPHVNAKVVLHRLVVESLSDLEHEVYQAIADGCDNSTDLAARTGREVNHIGNVLKNLYHYGLVERRAVGEPNVYYEYSIKEAA